MSSDQWRMTVGFLVSVAVHGAIVSSVLSAAVHVASGQAAITPITLQLLSELAESSPQTDASVSIPPEKPLPVNDQPMKTVPIAETTIAQNPPQEMKQEQPVPTIVQPVKPVVKVEAKPRHKEVPKIKTEKKQKPEQEKQRPADTPVKSEPTVQLAEATPIRKQSANKENQIKKARVNNMRTYSHLQPAVMQKVWSGTVHMAAAEPAPVVLQRPRFRSTPTPPYYPRRCRELQQEGTVQIKALVDVHGRAKKILVLTSSGYQLLDQAASQAVEKWEFEPARRNGQSLESWVRVPVRFALR